MADLNRNEAPLLSVQAEKIGGRYGRFVVPRIKDTYYFNPTLMDHQGKRYVIARKFWMDYVHNWDYHSVLSCMELLTGMVLGPERILTYTKRDKRESVEDPRCSVIEGKPAIGVTTWIPLEESEVKKPPLERRRIFIHQSLLQFDSKLSCRKILDVTYRGNGPNIFSGLHMEKNWLWFDHDGRTYFIYQTEPHIVVEVVDGIAVQEYRTHSALGWTLGLIRGGTPPVRVGNYFLSFFHSAMPWKFQPRYGKRNVYFMGAYLFEARPPFRIVASTRTNQRLLTGTWNEPLVESVPAVVYPNGARLDGNEWLVSLGVNDCGCGWLKIPHANVERLMTPC